MSYGVNQAWGLQAVKSKGAATWNQQGSTYYIAPGYANNIFTGDPVCLVGGYIVSWWDAATPATNPILGVFNGCSYQQSGPANVDPANPGRPYWPSGNVPYGSNPTPCLILDDPQTVFNIQTVGGSGATQAMVGNTAPIIAGNSVAAQGQVPGNTQTGMSLTVLNIAAQAAAAANANFLITRIVPISGNTAGLLYNNVEGIIMNHRFAARPAYAFS